MRLFCRSIFNVEAAQFSTSSVFYVIVESWSSSHLVMFEDVFGGNF